MSDVAWMVAATVVLVGAVVHGSVGFGINLVAGPILVVLDPAFIPGPLTLVAGFMVVLLLVTERSAIDVVAVKWVSVGLIPGTIVGTLALRALSPRGLELVVAFGVLLVVLSTVARPKLERTAVTLTGAGALSGFAATTAALAGPPIAILYQREPPSVLRGTLSSVFVLGTPTTIAALAVFGRFGSHDLFLASMLVPSTLLGFLVSRALSPVLDRHLSRATVLWVSTLGGAVVLIRAAL